MKSNLTSIPKAILLTLLYLVVTEFIGSWIYLAELIEFDSFYKYYSFIQGLLQLIVVLIFIYFTNNFTLKNLVKKTHYKWYILALILGISFTFMQTPLKWIYNFFFGTEYYIAYRFDGLPKFKNINLISTVLFIPVGEEFFFREYIQKNLQKNVNKIIAISIATLLFASIHSPYMNLLIELSNQDWHLFYITIFGGLISGILYYKSKSIGPSIIFHMIWNIIVIIT